MHTAMLSIVVCFGQVFHLPAPRNADSETIDVRYARAQLQLAEANLNRVEQSNKQVKGSVPSSVVAEYQYDVQVATIRLEQVTGGQAADDFQVWLQRAEAEHKAAETTWKTATDANGRLPGTFDPLDIERFRLRAEVAKLQFKRGQALAGAGFEAQSKWKLELLDYQVQRMKEESRRAPSYIRSYLPWRR